LTRAEDMEDIGNLIVAAYLCDHASLFQQSTRKAIMT